MKEWVSRLYTEGLLTKQEFTAKTKLADSEAFETAHHTRELKLKLGMETDEGEKVVVAEGSLQQLRSPSKEVSQAKDLVKRLDQDRKGRAIYIQEVRAKEIQR